MASSIDRRYIDRIAHAKDTAMTSAVFENQRTWQDARRLAARIYLLQRHSLDHGLNTQLRQAAMTILSKIAEGCERANHKELLLPFALARTACGELRSLLYVAEDMGEVPPEAATDLRTIIASLAKEIRLMARARQENRAAGFYPAIANSVQPSNGGRPGA